MLKYFKKKIQINLRNFSTNSFLLSSSRSSSSSSLTSLSSSSSSLKKRNILSLTSSSLKYKQKYFFSTSTSNTNNNNNNNNNENSNNSNDSLNSSEKTENSSSSSSSSSENNNNNNNPNNLPIKRIEQEDDDYYDDYSGSGNRGSYKKLFSYFLFGGISSIILYAGYSISMELFGRAAPNNLFNETFDLVRVSDDVMRMTGDPMRAYGMDTGRHTEGRRNFVASRKYKADDGSNRTRIRYTVSGPRGKAIIYAEVSDKMESHEFVYLITKDTKSGRVFTMIDNRTRDELEPKQSRKQETLLETFKRKTAEREAASGAIGKA